MSDACVSHMSGCHWVSLDTANWQIKLANVIAILYY